jgi:hypothetical protein
VFLHGQKCYTSKIKRWVLKAAEQINNQVTL